MLGGQFNGGRMVTDAFTNGERMVMLQRWSLMEGELLCYRGGQFNGGSNGLCYRWS